MSERDIFNKRCRLCCAWKNSLCMNLFSEDSKRSDIITKIKTYLSLEISHKDGLPELVCYQCLYQIESFHSFKKKCEEAEHTLKNWIFFFEGKKPVKEGDLQEEKSPDLQISTEQVYFHNTPISNDLCSISDSPVSSCTFIKDTFLEQDHKTIRSWSQKQNNEPNNIPVIEVIDVLSCPDTLDHQKSSTEVVQNDALSSPNRKMNMLPVTVVPSTSSFKSCSHLQDSVINQKNITLNYLGLNRTSEHELNSLHESSHKVTTLSSKVGRETHIEDATYENSIRNSLINNSPLKNININSIEICPKSLDETRIVTPSPQLHKSESPPCITKENLTKNKSSEILSKQIEKLRKEILDIDGNEKARVGTVSNSDTQLTQKSKTILNVLDQKEYSKDAHNKLKIKFQRGKVKKEIPSSGGVSDVSDAMESSYKSNLDVEKRDSSESPKHCDNIIDLKNQYSVFKEKMEDNQLMECMFVETVKSKSGSIRFSCFICNKNFSTKHYVKEHLKIHTGERSFICAICNRPFRNKYMLRAHLKVHLSQRDYKCNTCGKLFRDKTGLQSHMLIHSEMRTFICKDCGTGFKQIAGLRRHMLCHTGEKPYKCHICFKAYADHSMRARHIRTHTGERPYKCDECGSTFQQKLYLQCHKKTHTNERPFHCLICDTSFRTKAHLVKHLSCIHKDVMKSVVSFMKEKL